MLTIDLLILVSINVIQTKDSNIRYLYWEKDNVEA